MASHHNWKFFRTGGFDQVRLDSGADLMALDQLNPKLWAALACPTTGLEFSSTTLQLIDTDKDGRVRVPEVIAAVKWAGSLLRDPGTLVKGGPLKLADINDATPEGKALLASSKQVLANLGKKDAQSISVDDTNDTKKIFAQTTFNGDGVIPADAASDDATRKIIEEIVACEGALTDRSGKPGIDSAKLDQFFADCAAFADWTQKGASADVLPAGDATPAAAAATAAVRTKVDDYFSRCRLAAYDARAVAALNRSEQEYLNIAAKDLSIDASEVAGFPIARVEAGRPMPLDSGVNPAWAAAVAAFRAQAVKPLLGDRRELSEAEWTALKGKLAAHYAWASAKGGAAVEPLGAARAKEILASNAKDTIAALIARDKALEGEAASIASVDRLVRYHRDLYRLLINFVNFKDLYDGGEHAIFQCGTLYLDQRSCDLCIRVEDAGRHGTFAVLSKCYLAYCDVVRKSTGEKMQIAAAFTDGDSDNLMVGRNGIFFDRAGNDWDATITRIVDNPISIRQSFWSPYKKAIRFIEEQIAKRAAAADDAATEKLKKAAIEAATKTDEEKAKTEKPKIDVGVVAALGVGVGAIMAALSGLLAAFFGLGMWMPLGFLGLILLISGPSMVIAWLKLRQRNLGPLLDANGWAVNTKAKINIPFGRSLTNIAKLPPGSHRDLTDPYAEDHTTRNWVITIIVALVVLLGLWYFGIFHKVSFLKGLPKSSYVENVEKSEREEAAKTAAPAPK